MHVLVDVLLSSVKLHGIGKGTFSRILFVQLLQTERFLQPLATAEFTKGQRKHTKLHIAAGKQGCQIARHEISIRPRDIDVHFFLDEETVHGLFKLRHMLDLIEKDVIPLSWHEPFAYIAVQSMILLQVFKFQILEVDDMNLLFCHAVLQQMMLVEGKQRGFTAAAHARYHLDDRTLTIALQEIHIRGTLDQFHDILLMIIKNGIHSFFIIIS